MDDNIVAPQQRIQRSEEPIAQHAMDGFDRHHQKPYQQCPADHQ